MLIFDSKVSSRIPSTVHNHIVRTRAVPSYAEFDAPSGLKKFWFYNSFGVRRWAWHLCTWTERKNSVRRIRCNLFQHPVFVYFSQTTIYNMIKNHKNCKLISMLTSQKLCSKIKWKISVMCLSRHFSMQKNGRHIVAFFHKRRAPSRHAVLSFSHRQLKYSIY